MSEHILETRALAKSFKGFVSVNDVNLKIRRGTIHAMIGPNGTGKTTVFNLLTRFLSASASAGTIVYKGADITHRQPADIANIGIARMGMLGYCPEERGIFSRLNVDENLSLPPRLSDGGMSVDEI